MMVRFLMRVVGLLVRVLKYSKTFWRGVVYSWSNSERLRV